MTTIRYAKGPVVYLYDRETRRSKRKEVLWGDWLRIGDAIDDDWDEIRWGRDTYAIRKRDHQAERLCELIFLDVGQGDGCILTTPSRADGKERVMIVDAGIGDNMERYLNWRFRDFKTAFRFHAAVLTHPDADHYQGFAPIFDNPQISFDVVYHNGLLERTGDDLLGPVEDGWLTDLRVTKQDALDLYADAAVRGGKWYPRLLWDALNSDRFGDVRMLSTEHGARELGATWMPGFAPSDDADFTLEVLGPVVERGPGGRDALRTFARTPTGGAMDDGKTKNGHSILLRLRYRDVTLLFGGDLNRSAEHFLMRHFGNDGDDPLDLAETAAMITRARRRLGVDLMKTCHHGAADVTEEFLEAARPSAFIVSSGDDESHVHPRPDLLGLLGRKGGCRRPLVLCTELLRSTREREDPELRRRLERLSDEIEHASGEGRAALEEERADVLDEVFKRNVGVYGAINVRTDGERVVVAFRNERPRGVKRWFTYELERDGDGVLVPHH